METSFNNGSNSFLCYFHVCLQITSNSVFCMRYSWFVLFLLMEIDLKNSDRKQEETSCLLIRVSTESIGTTSRCTFNACDIFSLFQVLCRVCSSLLATARILQTIVCPQDTIPKCPIKLLLHMWIISIEPVTTLLTIQHQHKML